MGLDPGGGGRLGDEGDMWVCACGVRISVSRALLAQALLSTVWAQSLAPSWVAGWAICLTFW